MPTLTQVVMRWRVRQSVRQRANPLILLRLAEPAAHVRMCEQLVGWHPGAPAHPRPGGQGVRGPTHSLNIRKGRAKPTAISGALCGLGALQVLIAAGWLCARELLVFWVQAEKTTHL